MRRLLLLFVFLIGGSFLLPQSVQAAVCSISTDTVVNQAYVTDNACTSINIEGNVSTTWIGTVDLGGGTVTVKTGYTMTMGTNSEMVLGAADDFTVEANATTTHLAESIQGARISARNVTITGWLDVSAKGCAGTGVNDGKGPDLSTYVCTSGASGGGGQAAGGSYGGQGATGWSTPRATYGIATSTLYLGSGGGGPAFNGTRGGYGGGLARVVASGALTINGGVLAKGEAGVGGNTGGGSGGSIYLSASILAGSGQIDATGGGGTGFGGYGGGGRVAVYYDSTTFGDLSGIVARAGSGVDATGNGTVFILDRTVDDGAGNVRINSGFDFPAGFDATRDTFTAASGSRLGCSEQTTIAIGGTSVVLDGTYWTCSAAVTNITITGASILTASSTLWSLTDTANFSVYASSTFDVTGSTWTIPKRGAVLTILTPATLSLERFTLTGAADPGTSSVDGGRLFLTPDLTLSLVSSTLSVSTVSSTFTALSVDALSSIDVSGRGCVGGGQVAVTAYGPNLTTGVCGSGLAGAGNQAAGAGHGGVGGAGYSSAGGTYGSSTQPSLFGSGGGGPAFTGTRGGNGGGVLRLTIAGTLTLEGKLWANGEGGPNGFTGGGSGGSVYIYARALEGAGTVQAKGGASGPSNGGGGGGGRVFIAYGQLVTFTTVGNVAVTGGTGVGASGSGGTTSYLLLNQPPNVPASLGQSSLVDGSTTGTTNPIFTFTLSDDDVADTVQYRIQIDDSSDFSSPVVDYTSALTAQGAATFQVGQAAGSGAYAVGSVSQTLTDGSYYWRVKTIDASAAESSYTTANSGSVAFIVDSATRAVSFAYSTMSSLESVTATSVRVVLDTTHFENVTVNYSVTGGTATGSGTDYTLSSGTATITAGETSTTIALVIVNDEIDEPDETFVITLADPVYATLGATDELTYTITDNDTAGITSSESAFSLSEGGASDTFTLVLTSKPTSTVTVTFTTSTAGITLVPDALAFTTDNWATPQTVTISATDDSRYESSHTTSVVMTVSGGVYGYPLITPPTITATITDNETSDITLSASTLAVTEGSFGTLTFVLASQPTSTVTLVFATPSESALSASSLTFTADNWSTSQMLTVNILNNRDYVGTRTATLTTTVTSDTTFSQVAVPTVTITINEDDAPPGGGAVTAGPGAFYVPFPLDYVPPVTTVPTLPPQMGGEASSSDPVTDAPTAPTAPASNQARTQISSDATSFRVTLAPQDQERLASFIDTGTTPATQALGSGERRALVRDALDTMGRAPTQTDLERLAQGQIPQTRNLAREREQLPRARSTFRTIYGRDPNFQNPEENLAWNTLMYRIRFTRDLAEERQGIATFRQTFRRAPSDPFQWAVVRVLGYVR